MVRIAGILLVALFLGPAIGEAKERSAPSGREVFLEECARCHGADRAGGGPDAPFFSPAPRDLTTGFLAKYDEEELLARLRDGTPLSLSVDEEGRRTRAKRVESLLAHMRRIPDIDWTEVDAGGVIYGARCEVCHGQFGKPWPAADLPEGVSPPKDLRDPSVQRSMTDRELMAAFKHGTGGMPAVPPKLTEGEAEQLLAFVRVLSPGFETFSFYCAPCHGDAGRGGGILVRGEEGPTVVFDETYFEEKDPDALRATVWHMMDVGGGGMPHFRGVVADERLRAVVEYLKRTP